MKKDKKKQKGVIQEFKQIYYKRECSRYGRWGYYG